MEVKVNRNDKYEFLLSPDGEAVELIHQLCKARHISSERLINEIMLGGLCLQDHLFLHTEKSGT